MDKNTAHVERYLTDKVPLYLSGLQSWETGSQVHEAPLS